MRLVREMGQLAGALGIALSDRAVLPTASLCAGSEQDAAAIVTRIGAEYRRNAPGHRLSALQDIEAGRPLEVHETLGYARAKARGSDCGCRCWKPSARWSRRSTACAASVAPPAETYGAPTRGQAAVLEQRPDLRRAP